MTDPFVTMPKVSIQATVIEPIFGGETLEDVLAQWRVLPRGYRAVVTSEPSMVMRGRQAVMVTIYYGAEMLTRHIHYT